MRGGEGGLDGELYLLSRVLGNCFFFVADLQGKKIGPKISIEYDTTPKSAKYIYAFRPFPIFTYCKCSSVVHSPPSDRSLRA